MKKILTVLIIIIIMMFGSICNKQNLIVCPKSYKKNIEQTKMYSTIMLRMKYSVTYIRVPMYFTNYAH